MRLRRCREAACTYAEKLGLAFQIRDDMLDVMGNQAEFGKPIGSDAEQGKCTYVGILGLKECERRVLSLTEEAKAALEKVEWHGSTAFLRMLGGQPGCPDPLRGDNGKGAGPEVPPFFCALWTNC